MEGATVAAIATVVEAERKLAAAHVTLDLTQIDRLLHPDYVVVQPGGRTETKAQVWVKSGGQWQNVASQSTTLTEGVQ